MKYAILSEYSFRKLLKVLTQGFLTVKAIVTIFWKFHLHNSSVPWLTWQHFVLGNLQCTSHDTHVPSHTAKHVQEPPACAGFAEFFKGSILHLHLILVFFCFFYSVFYKLIIQGHGTVTRKMVFAFYMHVTLNSCWREDRAHTLCI